MSDSDSSAPRIIATRNGPYHYARRPDPESVRGGLEDSGGTALESDDDVLLCRCGGSSNKPFCDHTHMHIGFSGEKMTDGDTDARHDYAGEEVTVHDNRGVCAHIGYCTDELPEVFKYPPPTGGPWIDPDGAGPERVAHQTHRCPSGALSHSTGGVEDRDVERPACIVVSKNGPYFTQGGVEVEDEPRGEGASLEHSTLCRCGGSENKPFCDGTHHRIGFEDGSD